MGRKEIGFWTVVGFLGVLLAVAAWVAQGAEKYLVDRALVAELELRMDAMDGEAREKQLKIAKWYNWSLEQGNYVPEWDYRNILNLGDGRMGLLRLPELAMSLPITHGGGGPVGHDPASALPIGGREEQTVLYIDQTAPWREGMAVETVLPGAELKWQVVSIQVMSGPWPVDHPADGALLTLVWDWSDTRTLIRCRPYQTPADVEANDPLDAALIGGTVPILLIPVLCTLGKILIFLHQRSKKWRINHK